MTPTEAQAMARKLGTSCIGMSVYEQDDLIATALTDAYERGMERAAQMVSNNKEAQAIHAQAEPEVPHENA